MAARVSTTGWTPKCKAAVVAEFLCGLTMPGDIEAKYGVSLEELEDWCKSFQRRGLGGPEGYTHPADPIMIAGGSGYSAVPALRSSAASALPDSMS